MSTMNPKPGPPPPPPPMPPPVAGYDWTLSKTAAAYPHGAAEACGEVATSSAAVRAAAAVLPVRGGTGGTVTHISLPGYASPHRPCGVRFPQPGRAQPPVVRRAVAPTSGGAEQAADVRLVRAGGARAEAAPEGKRVCADVTRAADVQGCPSAARSNRRYAEFLVDGAL